MNLTSFADPAEFLRDIETEMGGREVDHHLLLGVARSALPRRKPGTVRVTLRDGKAFVLAAFMSPPRPLLIAAQREDAGAAVAVLAGWLSANGHSPLGMIADVPVAEAFVREWTALTGVSSRLRMRQRLFVLRTVTPVPMSPGALRQATPADLDLLERWMGAFSAEALGTAADPEFRDAIARRLDARELYLWEHNGSPRSMAASARPTAHGIAINSVYTPPELRGHGHATSCVAALSQRLLSEGRSFCVLFTDLANPTSNAIYARIGYQAVADSVVYELGSVA